MAEEAGDPGGIPSMTFRQVVTVMLRRWYVPVALILCAVGATMVLAATVMVLLQHPHSGPVSSSPATRHSTIGPRTAPGRRRSIRQGRSRENVWTPGHPVHAWDEAPLYGAQLQRVLVGLAGIGGQWTAQHTGPGVIQVVGQCTRMGV